MPTTPALRGAREPGKTKNKRLKTAFSLGSVPSQSVHVYPFLALPDKSCNRLKRQRHQAAFNSALTSRIRRVTLMSEVSSPFGRHRYHVMYVFTVDWFFCSHFLDRAIATRDAGFDVTLVSRFTRSPQRLQELGIKTIPWDITRNGLSPWPEVSAVLQLIQIFRGARPDIVHHVAIKPIVYGTLAALWTSVPHIVNAPVGLGFAYASDSVAARFLRPGIALLLRLLLAPRNARVVFENSDDRSLAVRRGLVPPSFAFLIRGAGVDLARFTPRPEPTTGPIRIALIGRMLKEKGVEEFVTAARRLRGEGIQAEWLLIGAPDPNNRGSLTEAQLERWNTEGIVHWLGERSDIDDLLAATHIVALPSYREGLPKALLEAMAAAKPIITTDVPGCRELCINGVNGLLIPARDASALSGALRYLIQAPEQRKLFGQEGRRLVEHYFSTDLVQEQTLALYNSLIADAGLRDKHLRR